MNDEQLATEIELLVGGIEGVVQLYDRTPVVLSAVVGVLAAVRGTAPASPVRVTHTAEGLVVELSVAVSDSRPAAETGRDVFDAVVAYLDALPSADPVDRIAIELSRVG